VVKFDFYQLKSRKQAFFAENVKTKGAKASFSPFSDAHVSTDNNNEIENATVKLFLSKRKLELPAYAGCKS